MSYTIPVQSLALVTDKTIEVESRAIDGQRQAAEVAHMLIGKRPQEHLLVICVDNAATITAVVTVSIGTSDRALVSPRDILSAVLTHKASAFMLAHNHPSGDPRPSDQDRESTGAVRRAAKTVGLTFLDHVIVTSDRERYSFHGGEDERVHMGSRSFPLP